MEKEKKEKEMRGKCFSLFLPNENNKIAVSSDLISNWTIEKYFFRDSA